MARRSREWSTARLVFHGCADSAWSMIPADVGLIYNSVLYCPFGLMMMVSKKGIVPLFSVVSMVNLMDGCALLICSR